MKLGERKPEKATRLYIKLSILGAALLIFTISIIHLIGQAHTEESRQITKPVSYRMYDERTVEITKYELFYRDSSLYSKEEAEFMSLYNTFEKYALFHHLEKLNYKWDEERRNGFRERLKPALEYDMKNENLKAYYDKMFAELGITEEEYIEYYLLVNKEYEILSKEMFNKNIGIDENGYDSHDALLEYQKLIGIPDNYLNELAEKIPESLVQLDPQPMLSFNTEEDFALQLTANEDGEYIFVQSMRFYFFISENHRDILSELTNDIVKEDLTRDSFDRFQGALKTYKSEEPAQVKNAKEFGEILAILERSMEMDYDFAENH